MTTPPNGAAPAFAVVSGSAVRRALDGAEAGVMSLIEQTYRVHDDGGTVNPRSYFLRFPDRPADRIIALPASLSPGTASSATGVHGLKWISSFPGNVATGRPRASAVLVLNDAGTGYPFACLEASIISATRTAASAALAADRLTRGRVRPASLGIVGTGLIARYVVDYLAATGWTFERIGLYDRVPAHADEFAAHLTRRGHTGVVSRHDAAESVISDHDLVLFATVAGTPWVADPALFAHGPTVLHVSLRDLAPEVLTTAANFVDDVEHCLTAATSPHLAEQQTGSRDFLTGTLADVLTGRVAPPASGTIIFSPFGLGVLDLAVGAYVHDRAVRDGDAVIVDGFFAELDRYDTAQDGTDADHH